MFIKGRETPMTKNEIAKSEKTMFPDILKKSNFLISSVYRASLLENKVLALALTKVRLSDQGRPVATLINVRYNNINHPIFVRYLRYLSYKCPL
jgi:hypothetical protein